jgi:mannose-6-phosphate isomerase
MDRIPLYPLRFEPIYQYRLWGGRRLANLLSAPLPGDGPLAKLGFSATAMTIPARRRWAAQRSNSRHLLIKHRPEDFLGKLAGHFTRFPLLLKFLDVSKGLSVQVHPSGCA